MDDKEYKTPEGYCLISEEVIATIASTAALEVPGVAGMANRMDIRGLMNSGSAKAVDVVNNENETIIDLYVNVALDAKIQTVGTEVQEHVKSAVQSMTGKPVTKVNVHIAGVVLDGKKEEPADGKD